MCLPAAYYQVALEGDTLSTATTIDVTAGANIAWLPLRTAPAPLRGWLDTPRLMRELGAAYDADAMLTLRRTRDAYDAVVVIRTGHDSSPTPTGVRKAAHD